MSVENQVTLDGQDVSEGAQAALRTCVRALQPYSDEPRIAAHVRELGVTLDPIGGGNVEKSERLARELTRVSKAEMDAAYANELDAEARQRQTAAVTKAQLEYLRTQSPAAADAFERDRAA